VGHTQPPLQAACVCVVRALQAPAVCMAPRSAHHAQPFQVARCALLTRGVLHSGRHRFGCTHHRAHAVIAAGSRASEALAAHTATTVVTGNRRYALHLPWQASPACCIAAESAARQVSGPRGRVRLQHPRGAQRCACPTSRLTWKQCEECCSRMHRHRALAAARAHACAFTPSKAQPAADFAPSRGLSHAGRSELPLGGGGVHAADGGEQEAARSSSVAPERRVEHV
jgi:hypothetical protein